jgi:hypothetical protein
MKIAALGVFFERQRQLEGKVVSAIDAQGCPRADARIDTCHGRPIPAAFALLDSVLKNYN